MTGTLLLVFMFLITLWGLIGYSRAESKLPGTRLTGAAAKLVSAIQCLVLPLDIALQCWLPCFEIGNTSIFGIRLAAIGILLAMTGFVWFYENRRSKPNLDLETSDQDPCLHHRIVLFMLGLSVGLSVMAKDLKAQAEQSEQSKPVSNLKMKVGTELFLQLVREDTKHQPLLTLDDLSEPGIADILDLSQKQKRNIKEFQKDFEKVLKAAVTNYANGTRNSSNLREDMLELREQANSMLSNPQLAKFESLRKRVAMASQGIEAYLNEHGLYDPEIGDRLADLREQYSLQVTELIDDHNNEILELIEDQQSQLAIEMCEDSFASFDSRSIELTTWQNREHGQLTDSEESADRLAGKVEPKFEKEYLKKFLKQEQMSLRLLLNGQLKADYTQRQPIGILLLRLSNSNTYGPLEVLADGQMGFMNSTDPKSEQKRDELRQSGKSIMREMASGRLNQAEGLKKIKDLKYDFEAWQANQFFKNLVPFQQLEFEAVVFRRSITTVGLSNALIDHRARFDLSDQQIEELQSLQKEHYDKTSELARSLERKLWDQLRSLSREDRDLGEVSTLFKTHPNLAGCPGLLLRPKNQKNFVFPRAFVLEQKKAQSGL